MNSEFKKEATDLLREIANMAEARRSLFDRVIASIIAVAKKYISIKHVFFHSFYLVGDNKTGSMWHTDLEGAIKNAGDTKKIEVVRFGDCDYGEVVWTFAASPYRRDHQCKKLGINLEYTPERATLIFMPPETPELPLAPSTEDPKKTVRFENAMDTE